MPVTAWYTAKGELIEVEGVTPEVEQVATVESLVSGNDLAMDAALSLLH
jgi:C-terminal processing protease CtpA/Prc